MTCYSKKMTVRQITLFGMLGALTFGAKYVMSFLPNIEPVSLLVMVYAVVMGTKALYPIYLFVAMDIMLYGLGDWNIMYLYVWALLWLAAWLLRKMRNPLGWAILSGTYGLLFGALCSPVYLCLGGWEMMVAKWISGLSYDLLHCAGNFAIALVLFVPMRQLLEKLYKKT